MHFTSKLVIIYHSRSAHYFTKWSPPHKTPTHLISLHHCPSVQFSFGINFRIALQVPFMETFKCTRAHENGFLQLTTLSNQAYRNTAGPGITKSPRRLFVNIYHQSKSANLATHTLNVLT